jgi:hypothetical protein
MAIEHDILEEIKVIEVSDCIGTKSDYEIGLELSIQELEDDIRDYERDRECHLKIIEGFEKREKDLVSIVRNEELSQLFGSNKMTMYATKEVKVVNPKCDKCDDKRYLHYTTPRGKVRWEMCHCDQYHYEHRPVKVVCVAIRLDKIKDEQMGDTRELFYFYRGSSGDYSSRHVNKLDIPYEKYVYGKKTIFHTIEECQGYCEFLNSNREEIED